MADERQKIMTTIRPTTGILHTRPENSTMIASHDDLDICAVKLATGRDALFINGHHIAHASPVAAVAGFCSIPLGSARAMARALIASKVAAR